MHILVINPNSTAAMTASVATAARAAASASTKITALNPADGPPSIQGAEDGERALPGLFKLFEREVIQRGGYDAAVIACFDDTGLWELKSRSKIPVLGIGEAAYHNAMMIAAKFTVITTLPVSIAVIEDNLVRYGYSSRCVRVRASGVPVLELESAKDQSQQIIAAEIAIACNEDNCDAIVLGCAGMADLAAKMTARFGLPVIDGVTAAIGFCEALGRPLPAAC